ncbi:MAG: helix-turn-helix domain-containing protein [Bacteroidia bacterium]|nr:helix-turn-helix domain-containing protein [Bacteroidia bacterium]
MLTYLGSNIRHFRLRQGFSSDTFAEKLGISSESLDQYEAGSRDPDLRLVLALADTLGISLDQLLRRAAGPVPEARDIRLLLLDVDGTLTDGGMYYSENGDAIKRFHAHDGLAIHRAITRYGLEVGLISAGHTEALVRRRAEVLGIRHVYCGQRPKVSVATEWLQHLGLSWSQTAYIGDDLNDLPIMREVALAACPADAAPQVRAAVRWVLARAGGHGCVREFIEETLGLDLTH